MCRSARVRRDLAMEHREDQLPVALRGVACRRCPGRAARIRARRPCGSRACISPGTARAARRVPRPSATARSDRTRRSRNRARRAISRRRGEAKSGRSEISVVPCRLADALKFGIGDRDLHDVAAAHAIADRADPAGLHRIAAVAEKFQDRAGVLDHHAVGELARWLEHLGLVLLAELRERDALALVVDEGAADLPCR